MRVLIDGYNLAHASTWLGLRGRIREPKGLRMMMVRMLAKYAEASDDRLTVVFDGLPADGQQVAEAGRHAGIEVIFSGPDADADTQIERMLEVMSGARDTLVVSSDRRVRAAAGRYRAKTCTAGEFFNRITRTLRQPDKPAQTEPPEKYAGLDEGETNVWMRLFGFDEEESREAGE